MKALRFFLLTVIMSLSMGVAAQNYSVKGVVIDSKGQGVVGATIRTDKSKVSVMTTEGGVFSLRATPRDKKLRLVINRVTVMEKELSEDIAKMPVAFEMDEKTDPVIAGYWVGDTYYPGEVDKSLEGIINKLLPNYVFSNGRIIGGGKEYAIRVNNSYFSSGNTYSQNIYSVKVSHNDTAYGKDGVVYITTKDYYNTTTAPESAIILSKDTICGRVTDGWGRPAPDLKITTPSGETTVTNDSGYYAIRVTKKDKYLRCIMPYTEGTTVRINKENWKKPINLTVMLYKNGLRGYKDLYDHRMYYLGDDEPWESVFSMWPTTMYENGKVYLTRFKQSSLSSAWRSALIVLDGNPSPGLTFNDIISSSVYSVKLIIENAVSLYGKDAQCGAIEVVTKGMQKGVVAMTDFTAQRAKRKGDMKSFIAAQGKNLEYEDGYIKVNGEVCQLYIINDHEYSHMRGIDVEMIDEIMILNDDMTKSYGPKAKHGVVLISASQKEKRVIDEEGNTVTEKEYKKAKRKK